MSSIVIDKYVYCFYLFCFFYSFYRNINLVESVLWLGSQGKQQTCCMRVLLSCKCKEGVIKKKKNQSFTHGQGRASFSSASLFIIWETEPTN